MGTGIVLYLVAIHEPGLTIYIENIDRRTQLERCLTAADVTFEVTKDGGFKAERNSINRMEKIWSLFENYKNPTMEHCVVPDGIPAK